MDIEDRFVPQECPEPLEYLWEHFCNLGLYRIGHGMSTVVSISNMELKAYCELRGMAFEGWEIDVLFRLDLVWLKVKSTAEKKQREREKPHGH